MRSLGSQIKISQSKSETLLPSATAIATWPLTNDCAKVFAVANEAARIEVLPKVWKAIGEVTATTTFSEGVLTN
jgi:hypothetical protein